jgi:hypothetical protein
MPYATRGLSRVNVSKTIVANIIDDAAISPQCQVLSFRPSHSIMSEFVDPSACPLTMLMRSVPAY